MTYAYGLGSNFAKEAGIGTEVAKTGLSFIPGVGTAIGLYDAGKDVLRGNFGGAALNVGLAGLGLLPGVGGVARGAVKGTQLAGKGVGLLGAKTMGKALRGATGKSMGQLAPNATTGFNRGVQNVMRNQIKDRGLTAAGPGGLKGVGNFFTPKGFHNTMRRQGEAIGQATGGFMGAAGRSMGGPLGARLTSNAGRVGNAISKGYLPALYGAGGLGAAQMVAGSNQNRPQPQPYQINYGQYY